MPEEFFHLFQSRSVSNPIIIQNLPQDYYPIKMTREAFDKLEDVVAAYYQPDDLGLEICDFLQSPSFLIADRFKPLFALLEPRLQFKGIYLTPLSSDIAQSFTYPAPLYWLPYIEPTDCLHSTAQRYDTGIIKKLVLWENAVKGKHILRVTGPGQEIWLISLTAAESILRRRPLAAGLERVAVRE